MNRKRLLRALLIAGVIVLALILFYYAFVDIFVNLWPILKHGNIDEIQAYLRANNTASGVFATILLQAIQVWMIILSGVPIQIAAGVVYGTLAAFAMCHLTTTVAMTISMLVWRKAGKRIEEWIPVEGLLQKSEDKLASNDTPPRYTVTLACMIPVMPNGLIPVMAEKIDITAGEFAMAVWVGCFINILLCCGIGSRLIQGDWHIALAYVGINILIVIGLWHHQKPILQIMRRIVHGKPQAK